MLGNWIIKWQKVISLAFRRYAFPETFGNKFPKKWLEQFFISNSISPLKLVDSSRRTVCIYFFHRLYDTLVTTLARETRVTGSLVCYLKWYEELSNFSLKIFFAIGRSCKALSRKNLPETEKDVKVLW